MPGAESYVIAKVGPHEVPKGGSVVIKDEKVLAGLPPKGGERAGERRRRVERVELWAERAKKGTRLPRWSEDASDAGQEKQQGKLDRFLEALSAPFSGMASTSGDVLEHAADCGCGGFDNGEIAMGDGWEEVDDAGVSYALHIPALAASFGPSLLAASYSSAACAAEEHSGSATFALNGEPLPLVLPRFSPYGCEPHHPPPPRPSPSPPTLPIDDSSPSSTDVASPPTSPLPPNPLASHLLLLHRGQCSFALKSHYAALSGAAGVVLISSPSPLDDDPNADGFVVPSADEREEEEGVMKALVPLVLVGNSTGTRLEEMVRNVQEKGERVRFGDGGEQLKGDEEEEVFVSVHRMDDEEDELEDAGAVVLGGYLVRNVKLWRGK
ncbi:hypothetical protein JCM11251_001472 [Rhodosporidiobolus azoricus]